MDTQANADINPSSVVRSFLIWSLNLVRISKNKDMSTSLKAVSDAAVFCDTFTARRCARPCGSSLPTFHSYRPEQRERHGFGFRFHWSGLGWAGFSSVVGGGRASFYLSGGGGEVSTGFSTAWSPAYFGSSGMFSLWGLTAVSVSHS